MKFTPGIHNTPASQCSHQCLTLGPTLGPGLYTVTLAFLFITSYFRNNSVILGSRIFVTESRPNHSPKPRSTEGASSKTVIQSKLPLSGSFRKIRQNTTMLISQEQTKRPRQYFQRIIQETAGKISGIINYNLCGILLESAGPVNRMPGQDVTKAHLSLWFSSVEALSCYLPPLVLDARLISISRDRAQRRGPAKRRGSNVFNGRFINTSASNPGFEGW